MGLEVMNFCTFMEPVACMYNELVKDVYTSLIWRSKRSRDGCSSSSRVKQLDRFFFQSKLFRKCWIKQNRQNRRISKIITYKTRDVDENEQNEGFARFVSFCSRSSFQYITTTFGSFLKLCLYDKKVKFQLWILSLKIAKDYF